MAGFEDAVRFASALGLDLPPTNKKMVLKEDFYEEAKQGQHLAVLIGENRHNPWHHVIYAGKEEGKGYVYHMTGDDKSTARIRKDLFSDFAKGRAEIAIVLYSDESDRTLQVQHAIAKCCHEHLPQENIYKVMNFNCEHFAVMCKTGKWVLHPFLQFAMRTISCMLREYETVYSYAKMPKCQTMGLMFTGQTLNKLTN